MCDIEIMNYKIEYRIDNYSGTHTINWDNLPENKCAGVYFLMDENKKILYVGKSSVSIRQRLNQHLFRGVPDRYNDFNNEQILKRRNEVKYFSFSIIEKEYIDMVERYFINKLRPEYNTEFCYG